MKNLSTAIFTAFGTSTLASYIGGRLYKGQAPDGVEFPYAVYGLVSDVPDNVFAKQGEEALIQFDLFSILSSSTQVETMYEYLKTAYDDCSMTITSTTLIWFRRDNAMLMVEDYTTPAGTQKVWHYAVDYSVILVAS